MADQEGPRLRGGIRCVKRAKARLDAADGWGGRGEARFAKGE